MVVRILVAGGPCTGKTTIVEGLAEELRRLGLRVYIVRDWAREIIRAELERGGDLLPWVRRLDFEHAVVLHFLFEHMFLDGLGSSLFDVAIEDGGGFAARAYCEIEGLEPPPPYTHLMRYADKISLVLLTKRPQRYFTDSERRESPSYAAELHRRIAEIHRRVFGDRVVEVDLAEEPRERVLNALKIVVDRLGRELGIEGLGSLGAESP